MSSYKLQYMSRRKTTAGSEVKLEHNLDSVRGGGAFRNEMYTLM